MEGQVPLSLARVCGCPPALWGHFLLPRSRSHKPRGTVLSEAFLEDNGEYFSFLEPSPIHRCLAILDVVGW